MTQNRFLLRTATTMTTKRILSYLSLILCVLPFTVFGASPEPIYVTNFADDTIYRVDPMTGGSTFVAVISGNPALESIQLASRTSAYTIGFEDGHVYNVNLETGSFSRITSSPTITEPSDLALKNSTTAYVLSQSSQTVYSLNLITGSTAPITTIAGNPNLSAVALRGDIAYVVGFDSKNIFAVNQTNGTYTTLVPSPPLTATTGLSGIDLLNETAYVIDYDSGRVFSVDLTTGHSSLLTTVPPGANPTDLAIVNENLAYSADSSNNNVYAIDLQTGSVSLVTPSPVPGSAGELFGLGIYPVISTQGLSGNILKFANYLNADAPLSTLNLFNQRTGSTLTDALKAAMPARLGFATFAAQNGYLASAQVVTDHLYQKRFARQKKIESNGNAKMSEATLSEEDLLASMSYEKHSTGRIDIRKPCDKAQTPDHDFYTLWLGAFGEYAREKKQQQQTPEFTASLGGAVLGMDYNCVNDDAIGLGGSYVYTHVHEKDNMGHAHVNQGFLGVYSTLHVDKWYFNLGLWGGYYHTNNHRHISFPLFDATAHSTTHGWQLAPHFEVGYAGDFSNIGPKKHLFGVRPFLLADWVPTWEHSFSEHGADGLNAHQKGKFCSLFRGETGLRFQEVLVYDCGILVFQEKGSYAYQKMFHTGTVTAFLVGAPGSFTVSTLVDAQNLGVAEFSVLFKPTNRSIPYFELSYQGAFGSKYQSHQGIFEMGKDF